MKLTIWILFLHFIGDFVFQSDWMARNKSSSWLALFMYVTMYSTILYLGLLWSFSADSVGIFYGINFAAHWLIDAVTSRINKRLWEKGQVHHFFVGVGFDQFLHATTLILTIRLLKGG